MRKVILFLFALVLTVLSAHAYNFEKDGIYYSFKGSTSNSAVLVTYKDTNYNSYSGSISIPNNGMLAVARKKCRILKNYSYICGINDKSKY